MSLKFLSIPQKSLTQSITSTSMSFKVNNIKGWGLNALGVNIALTASDFGTQAFCVFRNDTGTIIEIMEFDPATIASSSITILKRGLNFDGDLTTETTSYKLDWPTGTTIHFGTDAPQLFQYLKEYIDSVAIAGAPNASETVKGIVEEATDAEIAAGTATGTTGAKLFVTPAKLKTYPTIETTAGTTHSLTTIAGQKVIVLVKGTVIHATAEGYSDAVTLKYNNITKDTVEFAGDPEGASQDKGGFSLMYTETPGATTQNITVETTASSIANVVIIVMKF